MLVPVIIIVLHWLKDKHNERVMGKRVDNIPTNPIYESLNNRKTWIRGEAAFHDLPEEYQMRANSDRKVTLGMLLNKTFDIQKEELSDMYVVYNYSDKKGKLIRNEDDIWNYDLCSPVLWKTESGLVFGDSIVLVISYRKNGGKIGGDSITVCLKGIENEHETFFIRATICIPPFTFANEKQTILNNGYNNSIGEYGKTLSITFAYDEGNSEQRLAEFNYIYDDAIEKIRKGRSDKLSDIQRYLMEVEFENVNHDLYFGHKAKNEERYLDAIHYLSNAHVALQQEWIRGNLGDNGKHIFLENCYDIGWCYSELKLYEKALFYLQITWMFNNIRDKIEYINCLVNKRDLRAMRFVAGELKELQKMPSSDWSDNMWFYFHFLRRRRAYILIDMRKYDEAEAVCKAMLSEEENKDFALTELAYLEKIRKKE
jgi:tetratricopeptide (TPR) repeat protein